MDATSVLKALQNPVCLKISQGMAQGHRERLGGAGLLKSGHDRPSEDNGKMGK
jgi:hypothetical protein